MTSRDDTISYHLDSDNRIVKVEGPWDEFAMANDGPGACTNAIIGKLLEEFIAGDVSRMFVMTMLVSARTLNRTVYRPYRCDSGRLKRYMEMSIVPQDNGMLKVTHRLLYTEPLRQHQFIPAQRTVSSGALRIKRCSMCNKVHLANEWLEIEDALQAQLLTREQAQGPWIFGVCPSCLERNGVVI